MRVSKNLGAKYPMFIHRSWAGSAGRSLQGRTQLAVELLESRELLATLQFSNPTYSISENGATASVTVVRSGGLTGSVTVDYATTDGTAAAGSDYTGTTGTLTFADGQASETFTVAIIDDTSDEVDETVNVALSNPTGGATLGGQNTAVLTIVDNDAPSPTVGAHTLAYYEFPGPAGSLNTNPVTTQATGSTVLAWLGRGYLNTFTATTVPTDNLGNTSVQIGTTQDYAPLYPNSGFALYHFPSFAGGSGNIFSAPMPIGDELTFIIVEIKNGGLIQDFKYNRVPTGTPQTTLSVTTTGPATLVSFWTGDSPQGGVTAIANNGFTVLDALLGGNNNAIQAAVAAKDVSAAGTYDVTWTVSPAQTALMYLVAVQHSPVLQPGTLQFSSSDFSVNESQGTATITVTRASGSSGAVSVNYTTNDGTATSGGDYTATSGTLNFADGQTSATFTVPITDDTLVEGNQTVNLTLAGPTGGATLGTPSAATLTIVDNDTPAVQSVAVNGGASQRSMVTTMAVTFNTEVALEPGPFTLTRVGLPNGLPGDNATVGTIAVSTQVVNQVTVATLTFSGANTDFGSLQDGDWTMTVDRTKVQAANGGALMAADFGQSAGHRLFGDVDGDGDVDTTDFGAFRAEFGATSDVFDFDNDGDVDASDFGAFRSRFGSNM